MVARPFKTFKKVGGFQITNRGSARKILLPSILAYEIMYRRGNKTWKQSPRHSIFNTELSHANLLEIHTKVETALIVETEDERQTERSCSTSGCWPPFPSLIRFHFPLKLTRSLPGVQLGYFKQSQFPIGSIAQFRKEALVLHESPLWTFPRPDSLNSNA